MPQETAQEQVMELDEEKDTRPFSEKHPKASAAMYYTLYFAGVAATTIVSAVVVMYIVKKYGGLKSDGTAASMADQF